MWGTGSIAGPVAVPCRGPRLAEANDRLRVRLRELAEERRRWGYRRLHVLLRREGWTVNSKRVYRIYVEEKLMVRRRKRRRRICAQARVLLAAPIRANETWTMDFLQDALASGRKVRTLAIEDAYTREMLAIEVDTSLPSLRVVRVLEKLRQHRPLPLRIIIDNGTEFTAKALDRWAYENKVTLHFITPGRPMENGYIESFHGKFREECLNEHWFLNLDDARETKPSLLCLVSARSLDLRDYTGLIRSENILGLTRSIDEFGHRMKWVAHRHTVSIN